MDGRPGTFVSSHRQVLTLLATGGVVGVLTDFYSGIVLFAAAAALALAQRSTLARAIRTPDSNRRRRRLGIAAVLGATFMSSQVAFTSWSVTAGPSGKPCWLSLGFPQCSGGSFSSSPDSSLREHPTTTASQRAHNWDPLISLEQRARQGGRTVSIRVVGRTVSGLHSGSREPNRNRQATDTPMSKVRDCRPVPSSKLSRHP